MNIHMRFEIEDIEASRLSGMNSRFRVARLFDALRGDAGVRDVCEKDETSSVAATFCDRFKLCFLLFFLRFVELCGTASA